MTVLDEIESVNVDSRLAQRHLLSTSPTSFKASRPSRAGSKSDAIWHLESLDNESVAWGVGAPDGKYPKKAESQVPTSRIQK